MERIINIEEIHKLELGILKEIDALCKKNDITYFLHAGSILGAVRHKGFIPWDEDGDIIIPINQYQKFKEVFSKELNKKYKLITCDEPGYPEFFMRIVLRNQDPMCAYIDVFFLIGAPNTLDEQEKMLKLQNKIVRKKYMKHINVKEGKNFVKKAGRLLMKIRYGCIPNNIINRQFFKFAYKYDINKSEYVHCSYGRYGMKNFFKKDVFKSTILLDFEGLQLPVPVGYTTVLSQFYGDYSKYPSKEIIDSGLKYTTIYKEEEE